MTSPNPERVLAHALAEIFQAEAETNLDTLLTQIVSELGAGAPGSDMPTRVQGTLISSGLNDLAVSALAAAAVARLGILHHAVEQLADTHDANGMPNAAAELRKLVDDHG